MLGRLGGFYPQGRGFSSAVSAASAVRFFHPVDARWFSPGFSFPLFVSYRFFLVCIFVIGMLLKRGTGSGERGAGSGERGAGNGSKITSSQRYPP